jgi:hypothetical protein
MQPLEVEATDDTKAEQTIHVATHMQQVQASLGCRVAAW